MGLCDQGVPKPGREHGDTRGRVPHCPPSWGGAARGPSYIPKTSVSGAGEEGSSAEGRKPKEREKRKEKHNREKIKGEEGERH